MRLKPECYSIMDYEPALTGVKNHQSDLSVDLETFAALAIIPTEWSLG